VADARRVRVDEAVARGHGGELDGGVEPLLHAVPQVGDVAGGDGHHGLAGGEELRRLREDGRVADDEHLGVR
jgi:hypothetical protein